MGERVERPGALIASPVFALSIALLLVNDHVLKVAWRGFVTGKLSDVAGVAMVAIGLTALFRHRAAAFGLTTLAFTLLKTVPVVAVLAAPMLGGVTLTDPTDVGALAVLVPLWFWVERRQTRAVRPGRDRRWWVAALQSAAIVCAVFATSATSCAPDGLFDVRATDGILYARSGLDIWASVDGGSSWDRSDIDPLDDFWDRSNADPACAGDRCYEIVWSPDGSDSVQVVELVDGVRVGVLGFSVGDRAEYREVVRPECEDRSLNALAAVRLHDGDHVVVNMAEAGVLHRTPAGLWEWEAVGPWGLDDVDGDVFLDLRIDSTPPGSFGSSAMGRLADRLISPVAPFVVVLAPIALFWWPRRLRELADRQRRTPTTAVAVSIAIGVVLIVIGLGVVFLAGVLDGSVPSPMALIWIAIIVGTIVSTFLYHRRPRRPGEGDSLPPPIAPMSSVGDGGDDR